MSDRAKHEERQDDITSHALPERLRQDGGAQAEMAPDAADVASALGQAGKGVDYLPPAAAGLLQSTIGNRALGRLLQRRERASGVKQRVAQPSPRQSLQRMLANRGITIQTTLEVGAPDDQYEQEAARVASQVMTMPAPPEQSGMLNLLSGDVGVAHTRPLASTISRMVRRAPAAALPEEEEQMPGAAPQEEEMPQEEEETVPELGPPRSLGEQEAGDDIEQRLNTTRAGGNPLPATVRSFMEPRFGADFGAVRVHTGSDAAQMSRQLNAVAFTQGNHIYYGAGAGPANDQLTAHELTHVVQQTGMVQRKTALPALNSVTEHLLGLRQSAAGDRSIYRQQIDAFQQQYPAAEILGRQRQLLPQATGSLVQERDQSQALRACGNAGGGPTITHQTEFAAPDGTSNDRTDVGVGEKVTFAGDSAGDWSASGGTPVDASGQQSFEWTAPNRATNVTIKLRANDQESEVRMAVIEPNDITASKVGNIGYPAGRQGAGMRLKFNYHPMNVSFGNIEAKEVSGPATSITGYFALRYTPADLWHDSGDTFYPVGSDNKDTATDTASFSGYPKPWSKGGWEWRIPNHFRVAGEGGDGKLFTTVTQAFSLGSDGTSSVTKAGQSVERTP